LSSLRDLQSEDLSGISPDEWEYATYLLDLLEEKTGAYAIPVVNGDPEEGLLGFALYANGRIICAAEHLPHRDPSDAIDNLGYLFFYIFGRTEGEA
tara:strand:+ start:159 stop:446 length:288 start_codon:yes stop_codon:yes gene_type:complete